MMSERELKATLKSYELGVGPQIIEYQPVYHHKIDISSNPELEDPLDEWEAFTRQTMENGIWYSVSMEKLFHVEPKDVSREVLLEYCVKLIEHGIYHMDIHKDNVMKDKDGKLVLIDYGHIMIPSDPYPVNAPTLEQLVPDWSINYDDHDNIYNMLLLLNE